VPPGGSEQKLEQRGEPATAAPLSRAYRPWSCGRTPDHPSVVVTHPSPSPQSPRRLDSVAEYRAFDRQPDDVKLMAAIAARDEAALRALYETYGGLLLTIAHETVRSWQAAEEVVQDVFVRCWYRADTYSAARGSVAGWLVGVTRNRAVDTVRREGAGKRADSTAIPLDEALPGAATGMAGMDSRLDAIAAREALERLSSDERSAIVLAVYGGLTQNDIALAMDAPLGTVKSWIRRGMARLRASLRTAEACDD